MLRPLWSAKRELPRLLRLVAARQATVLNVADLARDARLPERSVYRYLDVLEAVFLVRRIPAWSPNLAQREVRAPKIVLTDPGVAVALRGHLTKLRDRLGDRFVAGVVLNTGPTALPLGERLLALPISVLWDSGGS